jgi:hypothetical protein
LLGALLQGCAHCPGECRVFWVVTSDDVLALHGTEGNLGEALPVLRLRVLRDPWVDLASNGPLARAGEEGFILAEELRSPWVTGDSCRDVRPDSFTLRFELLGEALTDTGTADFSPIEAPGGEQDLELWSGWTVNVASHGIIVGQCY